MAEKAWFFQTAFIGSGLVDVLEGVTITQGYVLLSMLTGVGTLKPVFTDFHAFLAGLRSKINVCSDGMWQIEKQSSICSICY